MFGTQYQVNATSPRDIAGKSVFGTQYQVNATSPRDIAGKNVFGTQYQVNATSPRDIAGRERVWYAVPSKRDFSKRYYEIFTSGWQLEANGKQNHFLQLFTGDCPLKPNDMDYISKKSF